MQPESMNQTVLGALSGMDISVIVLSIIIVLVVGLVVSRKRTGTSEGYFLAGRSMPWWIIGPSFVATSVSSEQMVGTIGITYSEGMGIANWEWFAMPMYAILLVFFLPVLLKSRITTVPEYYRMRFGPLCGDIYTWVMLIAYVFLFTVTVLYSGALAFSEVTGWNLYLVIWLISIFVGAYTIRGGMASVMWTNLVQCVMLLGGGTLLFFLALDKIPGGWSAMAQATPERFHLYQPIDHPKAPFLGMCLASIGIFLFYQVGNQYMIQRILGARSTWDGLMGLVFSGFINFIRPLTTCFLGLVVFYWIHTMKMAEPLENPDTTFPFALKTFAGSWGLRGFILAGFLAAVTSTLSSLINSTSTIFALDVYKRKINVEASESQMVRAGMIAAICALFISTFVAPLLVAKVGIFTYFQTGAAYLASPFIAVFIMGILWKRTSYKGAIAGMLGGIVIQCLLVYVDYVSVTKLHWYETKLHWFYLAFAGEMLTMFLVFIVSLKTTPPDPSQLVSLVWKPSLLSQYDEGVRRPWYQQVKLWFAIYIVGWVYLYYRFW